MEVGCMRRFALGIFSNRIRNKGSVWVLAACAGIALVAACLRTSGTASAATAVSVPAPPLAAASSADMGDQITTAQLDDQFSKSVKPILQQFCYRCHANGKHKGDVALDQYPTLASVQSDHRTWGTVADVLGQHLMPPDDKPQPTPEQAHLIVQWINVTMEHCDCTGPRDPGHVTIHRLNRNEYNNTVRDLLGVDFRPADDFPIDDTGYGFDNIADVLTMSPLLAEKYLDAAEQVLGKAIVTEDPTKLKKVRYNTDLMNATNGNAGGELNVEGEVYGFHDFPVDATYEFRISASQDPFGDEPAKMTLRLDKKDLKTFDVTNRRGTHGEYILRTKVNAGHRRISAAYINNAVNNTDPDPKKRGDRNLHVNVIEIDGPYDAPSAPPLPESHRRIFYVMPGKNLSEAQAARQIISRFASQAFRRPVNSDELDGLTSLFDKSRADGESFENAVKVSLEAAMVSPHFLYRIELDPPEQLKSVAIARNSPPHEVSDYELATRLSYFLWSSMPDQELLNLAARNELHEPAILEHQVNRMLDDAKSQAFVENFVGQWLELRNLDDATRDRRRYPGFGRDLRSAMKQEVQLFFANMISQDRSVLELIDSNYTFLNERLAKLYGITTVKGTDFRKVDLSECGEAGKERGGVLEMAGILTVTGMPTRTSPVRRGKFVLDQILGTPPPPQPADVPALSNRPRDVSSGSVRQRFERHRADPNCSVCHLRMDPIGFALENYDAIGAWRTKDNGFKIDTAGKLPDGTAINSADDVKKVLLARKDLFTRNLVTKTLTFALGRGVEYYDACTVRDIAKQTAEHNYRFREMVIALVESDAFLKRRAFVEPKPEQTTKTDKETNSSADGK